MNKQKEAPSATVISEKQKRYLRGLAHSLIPLVIIGKDGLEENVIGSIDDALRAHELIKVKLGQNCPLPKQEAAELVAQTTASALVQLIGKMVVIYRPNQELKAAQRLVLPKG